ncbi:hypothetical protein [Nocardia sp. CA-120079]|uniref:hypothetical protein n=1 Tax=Nocardia sp. CA-120079 TaxID=3239974 RepID=UPI003D98E1DD
MRNHVNRGNDRDELDAVVDIRSRRRCHLERSGLDPIGIAVRLLVETGDAPGWDCGVDDDGGWAA